RVLGASLLLAALGALAWVTATRAPAAPPPAAIPVTVGSVTTRTLPVLLRGIGTVQADNTVTIRSRVDGQIVGVDFHEGQEVAAGALLFQIDPRPYAAALAEAEAVRAKDAAQLDAAVADLARYTHLLHGGFQSRQSYDQQKALVAELRATIAGDEAGITAAKLNLDFTRIRAPTAGRLGAQLVDLGNIVRASDNTALVTIAQVRPIFVSFALPQQELDAIRRHQAQAPLVVEARSRSDKRLLARGRLSFIDNTINPATGTIALKARFANRHETLWPGEFVNVRMILTERRDVPTVPEAALQQGPRGWFVYLVGPDDRVRRQPVRPSLMENGVAAIASGLRPGQLVVVKGQYRLTDGARIAARGAGKPG
ncbi:MAG: efflux RND transporter periplasmic adaptor subunit, partial [Acetobacteraceae bacterium]